MMIAGAGQLNAQQWLPPAQVATERGIRTGKVLTWITTGQLVAVNHATRQRSTRSWATSNAADMRTHYVEKIHDRRLRKVTDHVHRWLYGGK